jgi:hypothetical protein
MTTRTAIIKDATRVRLATVRRYLPENYTARQHLQVSGSGMNESIIITGEDVAGWTLDGYVIPRLASGNIYAQEV